MGALRTLVEGQLKYHVTPFENGEISSVGATATRIMKANADRVGALIVNLSANDMYVGPFADVSSTKGIKIGPNGGSITMQWDEDFETVGKEWFIVATAAASNLLAVEYIASS